jgi:hypothetical protein
LGSIITAYEKLRKQFSIVTLTVHVLFQLINFLDSESSTVTLCLLQDSIVYSAYQKRALSLNYKAVGLRKRYVDIAVADWNMECSMHRICGSFLHKTETDPLLFMTNTQTT